MASSARRPPTDGLRLGNASAAAKVMRAIAPDAPQAQSGDDAGALDRRRRMLADFCKLLSSQAGKPLAVESANPAANPSLPPDESPIEGELPRRLRQTLELLLLGDAEKQIAAKLQLSRHTVHVYVKSLYKRFDVSSRGELLARFVRRSDTPTSA